jgi:ketosteroid isomerase-like protein
MDRTDETGAMEEKILSTLMEKEDAAMERWRRGDPTGFVEISAPSVSYFDPSSKKRVDGIDALREYYGDVAGKIRYDGSRYVDPRVQVHGDVAILTFNYADLSKNDAGELIPSSLWHTTEVYRLVDGVWKIVHTHWSHPESTKE